MAVVERFKQESMYGVSAKKSSLCREVAVSEGSTVITGHCSNFNEKLLENDKTDQFRFLGNFPPTPSLSQHFALSEK